MHIPTDATTRLAEPAAEVSSADWQDQPLSALIRHILDGHHTFTRTELQRLDGLSRKVVSMHRARHPQLVQVHALLAALADDLGPHLQKEEIVLFPYVVALEAAGDGAAPAPFGSVEDPVRMMNMEHEQVVELLKRMREVTGSYSPPDGACATTSALYAGLSALDRADDAQPALPSTRGTRRIGTYSTR